MVCVPVKPNTTQRPGSLQPRMVLTQLRCGGTPQLLTLMGKGFPTRVDFDALCATAEPITLIRQLHPDGMQSRSHSFANCTLMAC